MSNSPSVNAVIQKLSKAGYAQQQSPLAIASLELNFTAALRGGQGRELDLVLLFDTATGDFGDREPASILNRVETLSRALDVTGSRLLLTAVIIGGALPQLIERLSSTCRVLELDHANLALDGRPFDAEADEAIDDQIRLLLPLILEPAAKAEAEPLTDPMGELQKVLPEGIDPVLVRYLVEASRKGTEAVTSALGKRINEVLELPEGF